MPSASCYVETLLIRSETRTEADARRKAAAPVCAFLVIETFPSSGAAVIRETDLPASSRSALATDLAQGQWDRPHRILFVDERAGTCRDASGEIARLLASDPDIALSSAAREFCARHIAPGAG
ncbi:hypothetical protein IZ6_10540 [Terrihabitans soli]|uniref:Uncharacterized protein n=1 Tax=Terrihabitans soli TaxID=708113 RepID=A0A6S6QMZ2_9HYPH|nr:hypothetical protein [Terrihabitans soli]BCJ90319.1 hypothetical protein IZ6_10540 [Terrihabitans soli]